MQIWGADPDILKRGGALCRPPKLADEWNFRFQELQKGQNNVRNYKMLAKYFYEHFQIFFVFTYNESLPMKSCQFFKIYKRFDKEREKTLIQPSIGKEKLRKVGLGFITDCFLLSFNMTINHFFVLTKKEKKHLYSRQLEKKNWGKLDLVL